MMRFLIAGCCFVGLYGCELGPYAPDYGDAVHNNVAAQSVQPAPPAAAQPVPGNGETAALAQDRYAKDKVRTPVAVTTSTVSGVGGGGGSGGSPTGGP
jgi:hypothetical protein